MKMHAIGNLIKKIKGEDPPPFTPEFTFLMKNLENTKLEISELNTNINFVTDPVLLNQMIFQLKAAETRYRYWYRLAKEMKVTEHEQD